MFRIIIEYSREWWIMQYSVCNWISHALFFSNNHCTHNLIYVQVYFQLTDYVTTSDGIKFNITLTYIRIIRIKFNIQSSFHRFWLFLVKYNSSFDVSCEIFDVQKLALNFTMSWMSWTCIHPNELKFLRILIESLNISLNSYNK